jgi:hypothetical protein
VKAIDLAALLLETPEHEVRFYDKFSDQYRTIVGLCKPVEDTLPFVELDYADMEEEAR